VKTLTLECPKKARKALGITNEHYPLNQIPPLLERLKVYAGEVGAALRINFTVYDETKEAEISDKFTLSRDSSTNLLLILRQTLASDQYADYPTSLKEEFLNQVQANLQEPPTTSTILPEIKTKGKKKTGVKKPQPPKQKTASPFPWGTFGLLFANAIVFSGFIYFIALITKLVVLKGVALALPLLTLLAFVTLWHVKNEKGASVQKTSEQPVFPPAGPSLEIDFPPGEQTQHNPNSLEDMSPQSITAYESPVDAVPHHMQTEEAPLEPPKEHKNVVASIPAEEPLPPLEDADNVQNEQVESLENEELPSTDFFQFKDLPAKEWRKERLRALEEHVMTLQRKDSKAIDAKEKELDMLQINSRADGVKAMVLIEEIARMKLDLEKKWE